MTKFQGVHCLTLFFPGSLGADYTQIFFIGLKGEHTEVWRGVEAWSEGLGSRTGGGRSSFRCLRVLPATQSGCARAQFSD